MTDETTHIANAAAPQPTPDREALVRLLQIITRNGSLDDGRTLHEVIADALLASGLRLPTPADRYAALSQHLHGDVPNRACATYDCDERPVARYERGGVGSYYCADCAAALDFPDVTGPHPETSPSDRPSRRPTMTNQPISDYEIERLIYRIENRCGFDVMNDHEPCLRDSYEAVDVIRTQSAEIERLRGLVEQAVHIFENCSVESGVCGCGDDMRHHASPIDCGHIPTDFGGYEASRCAMTASISMSLTDGGMSRVILCQMLI